MFDVICVLKVLSCNIVISILDFVIIYCYGDSIHDWLKKLFVFNKKNINTFDVLTFIQVYK